MVLLSCFLPTMPRIFAVELLPDLRILECVSRLVVTL